MATKCEFEEKQFEQLLNNQLILKKHLLYPPGQVLEKTLGFDAALYTQDFDFWYHFPRRRRNPPSGLRIDREWWRELDHVIDHFFPKYKFNVFIQHKRPSYMTSKASKAWSHWEKPYFSYDLTPHQQKALEELESKIGTQAIVVYACPAFYKLKELWEASEQGNLIKRTNFAQPSKLAGHGRYTYVEAGNSGRAYSDPEDILSFDFSERIDNLIEARSEVASNRTFITQLGNTINTVILETTGFRTLYRDIVTYLARGAEGNELALALVRIDAFCFLTRSVWRIGI